MTKEPTRADLKKRIAELEKIPDPDMKYRVELYQTENQQMKADLQGMTVLRDRAVTRNIELEGQLKTANEELEKDRQFMQRASAGLDDISAKVTVLRKGTVWTDIMERILISIIGFVLGAFTALFWFVHQ